jgi:AraC-like DNA-binding protein
MEKNDHTVPSVLKVLADLMGTVLKDRKLEIPSKFGIGYCTGFIFNEHIRMLISNYELKEDIIIKNPEINGSHRLIFFKFQNIFPKIHTSPNVRHLMPSVLIATSGISTDDVLSIHTNTVTINIEVDADYLHKLFADSSGKSPVLKSLLQNNHPLLFEQLIYPPLQKVVDEIVAEPIDKTFTLFFLRIKAEELICKLLMELEKRNEEHLYALNIKDIEAIYKVRAQILEHLETPPIIGDLAIGAGISPTKLKRLFKQIFGNSIFKYYQAFRMKEAAILLNDKKLSVSDVGYKLGFTNLSHFSRKFEEHIGTKPKQYTMI